MDKKLIDRKIIYGLLLIIAIPFMAMIVFSFVSTNNGLSEINISGFQEISKDVRLQEIGKICIRSFVVCSIATIISYLISYLLVIYTSNKFQSFFLILITLPFLANEAVRVFSWQNVLAENGLLNKLISVFSRNDVVFFNSANGLNVYTTMIITCIPFSIFICTATFKIIPEIYWKVSNDLKLNQFAKFIKVGLPMSKTTIVASAIITFFIAFALSSEVSFLGGATKISTRGFILSLMSANRYEAIFVFGLSLLAVIILCYFIFYYATKERNIRS